MSDTQTAAPFDVRERLVDLIGSGTTDMAASTLQVPLDHYRDPVRHQLEIDKLFRGSPLLAAPTAAIPNPGDFTVRDVLDRSLLITRSENGEANVVLNYCTHRGALVAEGEGCTRRHRCPYHAWSFDPAGTLVGMPGAEGFDDLDRNDAGMVRLPTVEAHGFIWYTLDPNGSVDIEADLGSFGAELGRWGYESFWKVTTMDLEIDANWKTTTEAFAETYHFPYVHGAGIGNGVITNTATFDVFDGSHRLGVPLVGMRDHVENDAEFDPDWHTSLLYWKCPDLMLANTPFGVEVIQISPTLEVGRSRLRHTMLAKSPPTTDEEREVAEAMSSPAADAIRLEDVPTLTTCGRGLAEGEHGHATIGKNEPGVQNVHNTINNRLNE